MDSPKRDGATPLHIASEKGHMEIVRLLLNHNADLHVCRDAGLGLDMFVYVFPTTYAMYNIHVHTHPISLHSDARTMEQVLFSCRRRAGILIRWHACWSGGRWYVTDNNDVIVGRKDAFSVQCAGNLVSQSQAC